MEWPHYKFVTNGKEIFKYWVKSLESKEFFCCSSHNKSFSYPVFAVYKRHVTVALNIIISLWRERDGVYSLFRPCSCLVVFSLLPKPFGRWHFVRLWGAPTEQLFFFFQQNTTIFFQKIKYLTQLVCIIYWLWIKCLWLQRESNISKSCLSVGRYQILYLCGALCIMGTVITHKQ